jgi:hypothetical protein
VPELAVKDARSITEAGSIMVTSETLLTAVVVRLAVLVAAGLVSKTAAVDHPRQEISRVSDRAVVQVPLAANPADELLRDMRLHD